MDLKFFYDENDGFMNISESNKYGLDNIFDRGHR